MATILLSAAGAAIGGTIGGTAAGLSSVVLGRAAGATVGRVLDQRLMGSGGAPVETGKVDRFRLTQAGEGAAVAKVYGRMRVGGQIIWASKFTETTATSGGGGKGSSPKPQTTQYSYSVSLAVAVCEGEVTSIGRVWADGEEVSLEDLNLRVYLGSQDQLPDPVMEAVEGAGLVPAYRGTAYVVAEDLPLGQFGNRIPQLSFEVVRAEQPDMPDYENRLGDIVRGVAMMPGTGEYTLATSQVNYTKGLGSSWAANAHSPSGKTDFVTSVDTLAQELPNCDAVSLVVSWFGDDLRCGECEIQPKVERKEVDGSNMPWTVSGLTRSSAEEIARENDRPIYGGTPADAAVIEAIKHLNGEAKNVMFYPFVLMDQQLNNDLPDPWSEADTQPQLPWRGRITLNTAPGRDGSPDKTPLADIEVSNFFGTASASDFVISDGNVSYVGPEEWSMRRFILHYAALCAAAGGVSSFCIGSEMRGLTQIRGLEGFPAVQELRSLAADVRALVGPTTKIGYAADWSEYFGYAPSFEANSRYFHLDPLWADPNIDFVGIDNYMPLSDWREGDAHLDAQGGASSIYELDYLENNVAGGEGFDWYYHSKEAAEAQIRTPITDAQHNETWLWRYKDIQGWWSHEHHERIDGVRQAAATDWVPQSKPVWFTELGCAAVDKGTNQPNKFLDPKSSESSLPKYSNGARDDLIQGQYLKAVVGYWGKSENNPTSTEYDGRMIDLANSYVWSWDARPYPVFPNNRDQWSDGSNHARGHWLTGRSGNRTLASVVTEICYASGLKDIDVSELWGTVSGYTVDQVSDARSALQPLMLRYGFDAIERDGVLAFKLRSGTRPIALNPDSFAESSEISGQVEYSREAEAEMSGRVRLRFVQAGSDHEVVAEEAVLPNEATHAVATNEIPLAMTRSEGRQTVERWLTEARVSRETARFALPPSRTDIGAGDIVNLPAANGSETATFRVDRVEQSEIRTVEAVRIEENVYRNAQAEDDIPSSKAFVPPLPVFPVFLDLPLLTGDEIPHAPHFAISADPWPGSVAVYSSTSDDNYSLDEIIASRSTIGLTESPLAKAVPSLWDRGEGLQVKLSSGSLESRSKEAILNGANIAAIGDGTSGNWEVFQFEKAELVDADTYLLSGRLRGQLGSDGLMPDVWPAGSTFVLLDRQPVQLGLAASDRRKAKHYRIGPAKRGYDDPSYVHRIEAFDGNGLRPYAPVHLNEIRLDGTRSFSWIRRTRIDGDDWDGIEVPLGEESEAYLVRVKKDGAIIRENSVESPMWTYDAAMQAADNVVFPAEIEVAQISARFGPGLWTQSTMIE